MGTLFIVVLIAFYCPITFSFDITFQSFHRHVNLEVFWQKDIDDGIHIGFLEAGTTLSLSNVGEGHVFLLKNPETGQIISKRAHEARPFFVLHPRSDEGLPIQVSCQMDRPTVDVIQIEVFPEWSPRGAARFLELVQNKFFDGVALTRVVPRFLTQFGISTQLNERVPTILDDSPSEMTPPFTPGMMAYAGSGPNSRTSEMFFVMPGCPQHQLNAFGQNPWETPFGRVVDDGSLGVVGSFHSYGDMPPYGQGVQPQRIYSEGYGYLKREFPDLDYFSRCRIWSHDENNSESEEL